MSAIKIATWNVKDLKQIDVSYVNTFLQKEQADILFLQETKLTDATALKYESIFGGFRVYWNNLNARSSGVMVLVKETLNPLVTFCDDVAVFKGRVILLEFRDFVVLNTYAVYPGGVTKDKMLLRLNEYDVNAQTLLLQLKQRKYVVWCGDFNVADDCDIHKTVKFRYSKQLKQNFAMMRNGFVDAFRSVQSNKEKTGYTFWSDRVVDARTNDVGWRLDYAMIDERMSERLRECDVLTDYDVSDHSPLAFLLSCPTNSPEK